MKNFRLPTPKITLPDNPFKEKIREASQDLKVPDEDKKNQFQANWDKAMEVIQNNGLDGEIIKMIVTENEYSRILIFHSAVADDHIWYQISNQYFDEEDFYDRVIKPYKEQSNE